MKMDRNERDELIAQIGDLAKDLEGTGYETIPHSPADLKKFDDQALNSILVLLRAVIDKGRGRRDVD